MDTGEECDGGGESAACDADCSTAECGDGTVNAAAGEDCDDGNTYPGDGCDPTCHFEPTPIPAVAGWGLVVMGLVLLAGLKIRFGRHRTNRA